MWEYVCLWVEVCVVGVEGGGPSAIAYASSPLLRLSHSSENMGAPVWLAISRKYFLLALISMAVMGACGFAAAVGDPVGVVVGVCVGVGVGVSVRVGVGVGVSVSVGVGVGEGVGVGVGVGVCKGVGVGLRSSHARA